MQDPPRLLTVMVIAFIQSSVQIYMRQAGLARNLLLTIA